MTSVALWPGVSIVVLLGITIMSCFMKSVPDNLHLALLMCNVLNFDALIF